MIVMAELALLCSGCLRPYSPVPLPKPLHEIAPKRVSVVLFENRHLSHLLLSEVLSPDGIHKEDIEPMGDTSLLTMDNKILRKIPEREPEAIHRWMVTFYWALKEEGFDLPPGWFGPFGVEQLRYRSMHGDEVTYDFSGTAKQHKVDLLFTVQLDHKYVRKYYAAPKSLTVALVSLLDPFANQLLYQQAVGVLEPVAGEWDEPPQYANMMNASLTSIEKAMRQAFVAFFKKDPEAIHVPASPEEK